MFTFLPKHIAILIISFRQQTSIWPLPMASTDSSSTWVSIPGNQHASPMLSQPQKLSTPTSPPPAPHRVFIHSSTTSTRSVPALHSPRPALEPRITAPPNPSNSLSHSTCRPFLVPTPTTHQTCAPSPLRIRVRRRSCRFVQPMGMEG